jgi:hypothetical protein
MARHFGDAIGIEQAQLNARRMAREQREIHAALRPCSSEWTRHACLDGLH